LFRRDERGLRLRAALFFVIMIVTSIRGQQTLVREADGIHVEWVQGVPAPSHRFSQMPTFYGPSAGH